jgi:adhesin transport system membrane fusion protein
VEQSIARLKEQLAQAVEQGRRAEIRSPIDGIVKKLRYHTIGGVVAPGEPIMEIVPTSDTLVILARLDPTDRGYVHPGQPALVKITTYDFVRYGGLDGRVLQVAPDSTIDSQGRPYFEVIVETARSHLGDADKPLPISTGMQAMVDIHTGRRSVMEYLLKPVWEARHEALRER